MAGEYLGQGLSFPFRFHRRSGSPQVSSSTSDDYEHIKESIRQVLGTRIGERFMRPDFGSRLHELVFEGNDAVLRGLIRHHVVDAIRRWEKRVVVTDVMFENLSKSTDKNLLPVKICYRTANSKVTDVLIINSIERPSEPIAIMFYLRMYLAQ